MSVAFRRESDEEHKEPRFELPIPAGPNLVTAAGKQLIEDRLSAIEAEIAGCTDKDAVELLMRQKRYWQTRHATAELAPIPTGDEVAFGTKNQKLPPEQFEAQVEKALLMTGMDQFRDENPFNLPLSVRKFVTIAAIIAMDTSVLIFDEPTAGQDLEGNRRLGEILRQLHEEGKTVITISHDMDFVVENFARIIVIKEFGLGLAIAIFIDATIIRLMVVPALMKLFGKASWYFPKFLDIPFLRNALKE